jgi:two-component system alkaline phosphatase synthesis response regulator PhoP
MNSFKYRLLLVDDEPDILEFLRYNLQKEGYEVHIAENGTQAIKIAGEVLPHLILLDVMMLDMDGVETCAQLRKIPELNQCIIAFLTARGEDYAQIAGFEAGADDYLTKPIKPRVLQCRIAALLNRYHIENFHPVVSFDLKNNECTDTDLVIDRERYIVIRGKEEMSLPRKEFELLSLLYLKPYKVFTREDIFHTVWGDDIMIGDRTIDVHIRKLREKIGDKYIKTVKGVGYKFVS